MSTVTFMFGCGAVENAWVPVREAMKGFYARMPEGTENLLFANLVNQLRWFDKTSSRVEGPTRRRVRATLHQRRATYEALRKAIARAVRDAETNGTIRARPDVPHALRRFAPDGSAVRIITTNWDTTIDAVVQRECRAPRPRVLHVHGSARRGARLYLPSETAHEPYRSTRENETFSKVAGQVMRVLELSEQVVVYGLSFDPLDAELGLFTADAFFGTDNPKTVFVLDRRPDVVAARLRALLPTAPKIICHRAPM